MASSNIEINGLITNKLGDKKKERVGEKHGEVQNPFWKKEVQKKS